MECYEPSMYMYMPLLEKRQCLNSQNINIHAAPTTGIFLPVNHHTSAA